MRFATALAIPAPTENTAYTNLQHLLGFTETPTALGT